MTLNLTESSANITLSDKLNLPSESLMPEAKTLSPTWGKSRMVAASIGVFSMLTTCPLTKEVSSGGGERRVLSMKDSKKLNIMGVIQP
ncbi:hypothetical protein HQ35_09160 [Porphyromonas cangingivalis]|uniref:Uncharacterized protein n=1 Tax=Porphyromonas cangingivalis TaxID=36874 RepID=A0A0A2EMA2_PORCN|nr:hypothetical protein HQ35_09160 [Porphyromonas cangingivalis]